MDHLSKTERSALMRKIGGKNTQPEIVVRRVLHAMGLRFRLHVKTILGTPDIVLPRHKTVVFVHGCFWHRHPGCSRAYTPHTRTSFWMQKFDCNVARDREVQESLRKEGWRVIVIWECQTFPKNLDVLRTILANAFGQS